MQIKQTCVIKLIPDAQQLFFFFFLSALGILRLFHNDVLTQNKQQAEHESAPFSSTYLTLEFWFFSLGFLGLKIKGFFFCALV